MTSSDQPSRDWWGDQVDRDEVRDPDQIRRDIESIDRQIQAAAVSGMDDSHLLEQREELRDELIAATRPR